VALATQAGILAAPLKAEEFKRMSGGLRVGPLNVRLVWPAKDGFVAITFLFGSALGVFTVRLMNYLCEQGFCDAATRDIKWLQFGELLASGQVPISEYERVKMVVEEFTRTRTKAELLKLALEKGFLIAPITTIDEVVQSLQLGAREYWQRVEHPELNEGFTYPGPFVKFSSTPIRYRRRPPLIGEHNREIFVDELAIDEHRLSDLQRDGVI